MDYGKAEKRFSVGDTIYVVPPGWAVLKGIEAVIDAIDEDSCTYTLVEDQETFTVKKLVLKTPGL